MTADTLRQKIKYEPETGLFTWRAAPSNVVKAGSIAGGLMNRGYIFIKIDYVAYLAHRLAWLYVTGKWPENDVDHKDGNRTNNRFNNLRDVARTLNVQNLRSPRKDNKSGFLGVSKDGSGWKAQIQVNKQKRHIGQFTSPELAHAAYLKAKRELHPGNML